MTRPVLNKRICLLLMAFAILSLLAWFVYGYGYENQTDFNLNTRFNSAKRRHETRLTGEKTGQDVDMSEFSYEKFMMRRNEKLAKIKEKKTRTGKIHVYKPIRTTLKSDCVPFKTMVEKTRLCVHDKKFDPFISSHIRDLGTWEEEYLVAMATALQNNPDMHVVDIGCNVGTYTFYAALVGRKVVAVDPIRSNLFMVHSSLKYAGLRKNAVLLLNAVSEFAEPVRVILNKENIGGSGIEPVDDKYNGSDVIVNSIVMDDLLRVVDFKKVFLKIDIEAHEWKALHRADNFFRKLDVRFVLMEWIFYKHNIVGHEIIDFFKARSYLPFQDVHRKVSLKIAEHHLWPENVFWCKTDV